MHKNDNIAICRKAIWLFFYLLIFEGAIRKWLLPGFSDLFLIARDPIAIYVVFMACKDGLYKNKFVICSWLIAILCTITTLLFGHQNLFLTIYGIRIFVYYIPLIFAIPLYLRIKDIILLCKHTVYISIGMTVLLTLQYFSPSTSIFNLGVGGIGSSSFSGVKDYFRPSGTFSFTAGINLFMLWFGCCLLTIISINPTINNRKLKTSSFIILISSICFLISIPLSLSRTVFTQSIVLLIVFFIISIEKAAYRNQVLKILLLLLILSPAIITNKKIQVSITNIETRFTESYKAEGNFISGSIYPRFIKPMFDSFTDDTSLFYGKGIGLSTNVGAVMMTGEKKFLTREGGSDTIENGYILGNTIIIYKLIILIYIFCKCLRVRHITPIPLIFFFFCFIIQPGSGQMPTHVGFASFGNAITLCLALRINNIIKHKKQSLL